MTNHVSSGVDAPTPLARGDMTRNGEFVVESAARSAARYPLTKKSLRQSTAIGARQLLLGRSDLPDGQSAAGGGLAP